MTSISSQPGADPNFLIVGAQKCGTTSLYRYLGRHPRVTPAKVKEVHFFDTPRYERGYSWYRRFFQAKAASGNGTLAGEATPYYLIYPHAPARVAEYLPNVRIIILLRNPVDRAFSHYHHSVRLGHETLSFEEAIDLEPARLRGEYERMAEDPAYYSHAFRRFSYLTRGFYLAQIQRWLEFFPRDQLLLVQSEQLFARPTATFARVIEFLDLSACEASRFPVHHPGRYADAMNPDTRRRLEEHFQEANQELRATLHVGFE